MFFWKTYFKLTPLKINKLTPPENERMSLKKRPFEKEKEKVFQTSIWINPPWLFPTFRENFHPEVAQKTSREIFSITRWSTTHLQKIGAQSFFFFLSRIWFVVSSRSWCLKWQRLEQWNKGPLVVESVYRGWDPTQLYGDYFINHNYKDPY